MSAIERQNRFRLLSLNDHRNMEWPHQVFHLHISEAFSAVSNESFPPQMAGTRDLECPTEPSKVSKIGSQKVNGFEPNRESFLWQSYVLDTPPTMWYTLS